MNDIKNLSPAREKKIEIDWNKVRTIMIVGLLAIGSAWCTTNYLYEKSQVWNSKHGFQSPVILRSPIYNKETKKDEKVSEVIVKPVQAKERFCGDAISYIRCSGEDLGKTNKEIKTMIRIADAESKMNEKAKSKTSSATGLFQIISGTWFSNKCIGDPLSFKDNTDCAWKIQTQRNFQPWEVCSNGMVDCK